MAELKMANAGPKGVFKEAFDIVPTLLAVDLLFRAPDLHGLIFHASNFPYSYSSAVLKIVCRDAVGAFAKGFADTPARDCLSKELNHVTATSSVSVLAWCVEHLGYTLVRDTCSAAALNGHLECLKYAQT